MAKTAFAFIYGSLALLPSVACSSSEAPLPPGPDASIDSTSAADSGADERGAEAEASTDSRSETDVITAMHWRPITTPKAAQYSRHLLAAGSDVILSEAGGNIVWKQTTSGWEDVSKHLRVGGNCGTSASGGVVCAGTDAVHAFDGTAWKKLADCPSTGCGYPVRTSSGTLVIGDPQGHAYRRAAGATSWTAIDVPAPTDCSRIAVAGDHVVVCGRYSSDDGVTFSPLDVPSATVTTAGYLYNDADFHLRADSGAVSLIAPGLWDVSVGGGRVFAVQRESKQRGISLDGGKTWKFSTLPSDSPLLVANEIAVSSSLVAVRTDTSVAKSTDDGVTFGVVTAIPEISFPLGFAYRGGETPELWTIMDRYTHQGRAYRSSDDGATWIESGSASTWNGALDLTGDRYFVFESPSTHFVYAGTTKDAFRFDLGSMVNGHLAGSRFGTGPGPVTGRGGRMVSRSSGSTWLDAPGDITDFHDGPVGPSDGFPGFPGAGVDSMGTVWVDANGWIFTTTDGGVTWTRESEATAGRIWFDVAANGTFFDRTATDILKSNDHGKTWTKIASTSLGLGGAVSLVPSLGDRLVVVDADGDLGFKVLVSKDGGATFENQTFDLPRPPSGFFGGNGHLWATVRDYGLFELVEP